jgi:hypothetical protein
MVLVRRPPQVCEYTEWLGEEQGIVYWPGLSCIPVSMQKGIGSELTRRAQFEKDWWEKIRKSGTQQCVREKNSRIRELIVGCHAWYDEGGARLVGFERISVGWSENIDPSLGSFRGEWTFDIEVTGWEPIQSEEGMERQRYKLFTSETPLQIQKS